MVRHANKSRPQQSPPQYRILSRPSSSDKISSPAPDLSQFESPKTQTHPAVPSDVPDPSTADQPALLIDTPKAAKPARPSLASTKKTKSNTSSSQVTTQKSSDQIRRSIQSRDSGPRSRRKSYTSATDSRVKVVRTTPNPTKNDPRPMQAEVSPRPASQPKLSQTPTRKIYTPSQAYAGPTFHASPAASALPLPKFLSKSVPEQPKASDLKETTELDVDLVAMDHITEAEPSDQGEESPSLRKSRAIRINQAEDDFPHDIFHPNAQTTAASCSPDALNNHKTVKEREPIGMDSPALESLYKSLENDNILRPSPVPQQNNGRQLPGTTARWQAIEKSSCTGHNSQTSSEIFGPCQSFNTSKVDDPALEAPTARPMKSNRDSNPTLLSSENAKRRHSRQATDTSVTGLFPLEMEDPKPAVNCEPSFVSSVDFLPSKVIRPRNAPSEVENQARLDEEQRKIKTIALKMLLTPPVNQRAVSASPPGRTYLSENGSPHTFMSERKSSGYLGSNTIHNQEQNEKNFRLQQSAQRPFKNNSMIPTFQDGSPRSLTNASGPHPLVDTLGPPKNPIIPELSASPARSRSYHSRYLPALQNFQEIPHSKSTSHLPEKFDLQPPRSKISSRAFCNPEQKKTIEEYLRSVLQISQSSNDSVSGVPS